MKQLWYIKTSIKLEDDIVSLMKKMADATFVQVDVIPKEAAHWQFINGRQRGYVAEMAFGGWIIEEKTVIN
jgi:hypothetical protein